MRVSGQKVDLIIVLSTLLIPNTVACLNNPHNDIVGSSLYHCHSRPVCAYLFNHSIEQLSNSKVVLLHMCAFDDRCH